MVQAAVLDSLLFDSPPFGQDGFAATKIDIAVGKVADAFMIPSVVVVVDDAVAPLPFTRRLLAHPIPQRKETMPVHRSPTVADGCPAASSPSCAMRSSCCPHPLGIGMQPGDQITQRRPYDEQWQAPNVDAISRDGTSTSNWIRIRARSRVNART